MPPLIIFVTGPSGAGKTTLAQKLSKHYDAPCIPEDFYFHGAKTPDENIDQPSAVDHDLLIAHLAKLKSGQAIEQPTYDHSTLSRKPETKIVEPAPIIIVEGMFLLSNPKLRELCDFGIYVDAPEGVCSERRFNRDEKERGVTREKNKRYYSDFVLPGFFKYVKPVKEFADWVFDNSDEKHFPRNFRQLTTLINAKLDRVQKSIKTSSAPPLRAKL